MVADTNNNRVVRNPGQPLGMWASSTHDVGTQRGSHAGGYVEAGLNSSDCGLWQSCSGAKPQTSFWTDGYSQAERHPPNGFDSYSDHNSIANVLTLAYTH